MLPTPSNRMWQPAANFATSFPCVVDTGGKFATGVNGVNDAGGKLPPVSTTPAANLPPVSLISVANNWNNIRLRTPESELEGKNLHVSSTTQRWPNKIIKIFLIEDFFHLPLVSLTPVANLELRISQRIFEKIRNGPNGILWGWGETDSWKEPEAKNLVNCPFNNFLKSAPNSITICSGMSHPPWSLSRIVCRVQEGPTASKGTLRPDFQANTRLRIFLKPVSQDTGRRL